MAAQVDGDTLAFRFSDPAGALRGVRLQQDVRLPGDRSTSCGTPASGS